VYEGAPTPIAAFFRVGPKAAGFALMIRFFYTSMQPVVDQVDWPMLIAVLSVATMTWANLAAVRQDNVKRMLAFSSVAHVGYLLMAFLMLTDQGLQAILFSLTGLPPTAGFIGKFNLFAEVMRQEWYWLAIVGVLNSVVSLFY
jgi:NADH-quinone oxidoreductase subunit N